VILNSFLRLMVVGVSTSLFYIVFSLGLTLIFGLNQVVNFAHGAIYMIGAFIGLLFYTITDNFVISLIASFLCSMVLAAVIERGLVSKLYGTDPANNFLLTYAIGLGLIGVVKLIAGSTIRSFPIPKFLSGNISIGTVVITHYQLFFMGSAGLLIVFVFTLLKMTTIGTVIRASITDRSSVEVLGIRAKNYFTLLFAIGSGLAGIAGVLIAPSLSVYPGMGDHIILWGFIIVIIGGLGSFKGAIIGGTIIGALHSIGLIYIGPAIQSITYVILILILLLKPEGLFGGRKI
jgi:branched-subunit amino acid ABC-type transport system permease component